MLYLSAGADDPKGACFTLKSLIQMPLTAKIQISSLATNVFAFVFTLGSPFKCLVADQYPDRES